MASQNSYIIKTTEDIDKLSKFKRILPNDPCYKNYTHCSHAMIYARTKSKSLKIYNRIASILMQMRYDGFIGFPGGGVDDGESPVEAVNRELREESGWCEKSGPIKECDYQFTHVDEENKMVLHFYALEVSEAKIAEIESKSLSAPDFGEEVLGNFRVPLYTMEDSYRGFPAFLKNNFVGNAKCQLLECLITQNIFSCDSIFKALNH